MSKYMKCFCVIDSKKRSHRPDILSFDLAELELIKSIDDNIITFIEHRAFEDLKKQIEILEAQLREAVK